jgi:hypothetical protein
VLWEDDVVVVKVNPQASHGYLYICTYLRPAPVNQESIGEAAGDAVARKPAGGEPSCG